MTQVSIEYQVNPRFVPNDIPLWLGNAKDSAIIYDATAGELTLQTHNASAVLTDRIRVESGTDTPFVELAAGRVRLLDAAADPAAAGEITRNGADLKVYTGGGVKSLSDIGGGLANIVEDTTPQLGGDLASNGNDIFLGDNDGIVVGHTARISPNAVAYEVQVLGTGDADSGIVVARHSADGTGPEVVFVKGRDAIGTYTTALSDNDAMGRLVWNGADGGDIVPQAASLRVQVDGSTGDNDMPGEMIFATTADGSQSPTDRMSLTAAGAMDLQSATTILNVGAAGNDWTQNALTLAGGSAEQVITAQTTGSAVDAKLDLLLPASSTGNARVRFKQGDGSGDANNMMYQLYYEASSDYLVLRSADSDGGSTAADIWRVPDGQTSIDANTTWDINIFDNYDDAMILSPYRRGVMNLAQRTRELVEMGVLREYEDGWIGYNDQRMAALLAGGIYQTRQRLDSFHTDHERRIGELEIENRRLKELIHA